MPTQLSLTWHPNTADMKLGLALSSWGTRGRVLKTLAMLFLLPASLFGVFTQSVWLGISFGLLFGVLCLLAFPSTLARMLLKTQLARAQTHEIIVSPEAIERIVAGTVVRHPWSAITKVLELPSAFLLFHGPTPIGSIEKSAAPDQATLATVRALISSVRPIYVRSSAFLALERRSSET